MKTCCNCFEFKPLTAFYRKLDGLQSRCKSCNAEVVRAYFKRLQKKRIAQRWKELRAENHSE